MILPFNAITSSTTIASNIYFSFFFSKNSRNIPYIKLKTKYVIQLKLLFCMFFLCIWFIFNVKFHELWRRLKGQKMEMMFTFYCWSSFYMENHGKICYAIHWTLCYGSEFCWEKSTWMSIEKLKNVTWMWIETIEFLIAL